MNNNYLKKLQTILMNIVNIIVVNVIIILSQIHKIIIKKERLLCIWQTKVLHHQNILNMIQIYKIKQE